MKRYLEKLDDQFVAGSIFQSPISASEATREGKSITFDQGVFTLVSDGFIHCDPKYPDPTLIFLALWDGKIAILNVTVGFLYELKRMDGSFVL